MGRDEAALYKIAIRETVEDYLNFLDGDFATCDSRLTASLLYIEGNEHQVAVRAIWYRDKLRREGDRWLICERVHEPQWQYDVSTHALRL